MVASYVTTALPTVVTIPKKVNKMPSSLNSSDRDVTE